MAEHSSFASETEEHFGLDEETIHNLLEALMHDHYDQVNTIIHTMHSADIADFMAITYTEARQKLIELLRPHFDPEILICLDPLVRTQVMDQLGLETSALLLTKLETDDVVYAIEDLSHTIQQEILTILPIETRIAVEEALAYPENSAGRIMQKRLVFVPEYWTVGQTIDYFRQNQNLPEEFYEIFIVDPKHRPIGGVIVSRILRSDRSVVVNDIMESDLDLIPTDMDQEEVSYLFKKYTLTAAPVINKDGRLVGVITVDDIVEIIEEEAEEDILRLGGISRTDIHSAFFQTAQHRFRWLFVNLVTASLASMVIGHFAPSIQTMVILASLMPIVASMGGNAGTQALTVVTRGIATKEITSLNSFRLILKETMVGMCNGVGFAFLSTLLLWFWQGDFSLALVFAAAIIVNLTIAGLAGACIPLFLNRLKIDPAITSSIFVTTITDVIGFLAFLGLASWLLL